MFKNKLSSLWIGWLIISLIFLVGCPKKTKPVIEPPKPETTVTSSTATVPTTGDIETWPIEPPEPPIRGKTDWDVIPDLKTVYFDYDKSELSREGQDVLAKNAESLKKFPGKTVLVEGHCCECGTIEYNIGLGQRRAKMVRDYYIQLGIEPQRIATISYGKEKPVYPGVCPPDNLEFGGKNRRAETKLGK